MKINEKVKEELEFVRSNTNGILRAQDVVEYAKDPSTELHRHFEWDDNKAAEAHRLNQARMLINVCVIVNPVNNKKIKAYVSLKSERKHGIGYRAVVDVLKDSFLTEELMQDALKDLERFQEKYNRLKEATELGPVFSAIETVRTKTVKQTKQALAG